MVLSSGHSGYKNKPLATDFTLPKHPCSFSWLDPIRSDPFYLNHQTLDLVLQGADLSLQVGALVGRDGRSDDGAGHTTRATECLTDTRVSLKRWFADHGPFGAATVYQRERVVGTYHLGADVDVGDVLVLAQEGKVEDDGEGNLEESVICPLGIASFVQYCETPKEGRTDS